MKKNFELIILNWSEATSVLTTVDFSAHYRLGIAGLGVLL
jgi:hypothetical protein